MADRTRSDLNADAARPAGEAERRRRLEKVFGDVLPESDRDERGGAWGEAADSRDEDLLRDVPPHHG
jgi:hypothetical protein